ncbi:MAG: hypothetical protein K0S08_44 [Gammaproteobacteria bacterium]|jgi:hypothetical protein|nr:hypothetical protein [Gammaproteobacteria bacterium]
MYSLLSHFFAKAEPQKTERQSISPDEALANLLVHLKSACSYSDNLLKKLNTPDVLGRLYQSNRDFIFKTIEEQGPKAPLNVLKSIYASVDVVFELCRNALEKYKQLPRDIEEPTAVVIEVLQKSLKNIAAATKLTDIEPALLQEATELTSIASAKLETVLQYMEKQASTPTSQTATDSDLTGAAAAAPRLNR